MSNIMINEFWKFEFKHADSLCVIKPKTNKNRAYSNKIKSNQILDIFINYLETIVLITLKFGILIDY